MFASAREEKREHSRKKNWNANYKNMTAVGFNNMIFPLPNEWDYST